MQESIEKKQRDHLWRYIIFTFIVSVVAILSFLTYQNFSLLKAELSDFVTSVNNINVAGVKQDDSFINMDSPRDEKDDQETAKSVEKIMTDTAQEVVVQKVQSSDGLKITNETASIADSNNTVNNVAIQSGTDIATVKNFYIPTDLKASPNSSILIPVKNGKKIEGLGALTLRFKTNPASSINVYGFDLSSPSVLQGELPIITQYPIEGALKLEFKSLKRKYTLGANSTLFNIKAEVKTVPSGVDRIQISLDSDNDVLESASTFNYINDGWSETGVPTFEPGYINVNTDLCTNLQCPANATCSQGACVCNTGYTEKYCDICDTGYVDVGTNGKVDCQKGTSGDINGDDQLTMLDVVTVFSIANNSLTPTATQLKKADMNLDGKVTMMDVIIIFNKVVNGS